MRQYSARRYVTTSIVTDGPALQLLPPNESASGATTGSPPMKAAASIGAISGFAAFTVWPSAYTVQIPVVPSYPAACDALKMSTRPENQPSLGAESTIPSS